MSSFLRRLAVIVLTSTTICCKTQKPVFNNPDWSKDYPPFRIAGNLYYVGTYELGCFLITTKEGSILINTGTSGSDTLIQKHIEALGFKVEDIKILLTNQAHIDHVGAMAAMKKKTHAALMVEEKDAPVVEDGGNSDYLFGGKGAYFRRAKVDRLLHARDTIRLGDMVLEVLSHPGHTKGSCSYLFTVTDQTRSYKVLIANIPTIILDEKSAFDLAAYPDMMKDYAYTLDTMPKLSFDIWMAPHASQFGLEKKRKPGDPYNPMVFADRKGYDTAIAEQQKDFDERRRKGKSL